MLIYVDIYLNMVSHSYCMLLLYWIDFVSTVKAMVIWITMVSYS